MRSQAQDLKQELVRERRARESAERLVLGARLWVSLGCLLLVGNWLKVIAIKIISAGVEKRRAASRASARSAAQVEEQFGLKRRTVTRPSDLRSGGTSFEH